MRTIGSVCTILTLVAASAACQKTSPTAPSAVTNGIAASAAGASATAATKASLYTFTKIPAPVSNLTIAPGSDVQIYAFDLTTDKTKAIDLSSLSFMISGSLQAGNLTNFRLGSPTAHIAVAGSSCRIPSVASKRVEIGTIRAVRVFAFTASIISSRRSRFTSRH